MEAEPSLVVEIYKNERTHAGNKNMIYEQTLKKIWSVYHLTRLITGGP